MSILRHETEFGDTSPDNTHAEQARVIELRRAADRQAATVGGITQRPMGCAELQYGAFDPAEADEIAQQINRMNADIEEGTESVARTLAAAIVVVLLALLFLHVALTVWPPTKVTP